MLWTSERITKSELRSFGFVVGGIVALVWGLSLPWIKGRPLSIVPFTAGTFLICLAVLRPQFLVLPCSLWMRLGNVLGHINTRIILSFIFFGVITPYSFILRALKKDPMVKYPDSRLDTYRTAHPDRQDRGKNMIHPY